MAIPSVMQGLIEVEGGKVFELDSPQGATWLRLTPSFRYEPIGASKPCTVRKESGKGGDYWYGYRKMSGRLHKKYIGKSSEVSTAKLEEVAEALNTPPQSRVTDKVTQDAAKVTDTVTDSCDSDRLTALEVQVQALQESLEALRSELLGKSESGNSEELPTVTDNGLQNKLSNLSAENELLREEVARLRSRLDQERVDHKEVEVEVTDILNREEVEVEVEAADILNRLKARRGKSKTDLRDMEIILEILEG
ncbi:MULTISPECIES: hypothetical protein [unclassified Microcoleus]|uniref:hypothetical protein n=1 Tax=unclassified Microcoleus TaxID=2642155 RepID=UPI002FD23087